MRHDRNEQREHIQRSINAQLLKGVGQLRASNVPKWGAGVHDNIRQVVSKRRELRSGRVQHPSPLRQDGMEPL